MREKELDTLTNVELIAYRNICLMSKGTIMSTDDRLANAGDLVISENLLKLRGVAFESGQLIKR